MTDSKIVQPPPAAEDDVLLTPKEAARRIGMSLSWLTSPTGFIWPPSQRIFLPISPAARCRCD
jgi:hypothetical protein